MKPYMPGYVILVIGFLCYGVGVLSPAWQETPWVPTGSVTEKNWIGPWLYCRYFDQKMDPPQCQNIQLADPLSVDQLVLLGLTGLSTLCYVVAVVLGSALMCCCRSPTTTSRWTVVSAFAALAGMCGCGGVIKFAMADTQASNSYIFGFYLTIGGSFLAIFSSLQLCRNSRPQSSSKISSHSSF